MVYLGESMLREMKNRAKRYNNSW